jgi:DNA polymerase-3 subunit delta'
MFNSELDWLAADWHKLKQLVASDRLPHAMLWIAPEGIGVDNLADSFLALLMCHQPTREGHCGVCTSCQLFSAGSHPDYHHITIEPKKRDISIEQIRTLIEQLNERPHQNGRRVVFLEPAHAMNRSTANAFLKTLEEPGDDTLLLLLSSRLDAISATIRSRCQIRHLHGPDEDRTIDYIMEHHPDQPAIARQAARLSQNQPLLALSLINNGALEARQNFFAYLASMLNNQMDPLAYAVKHKTAEEVIQVVDWLYELLLDTEKMQAGVAMEQLLNRDQQPLLEQLSAKPPAQRQQWQESLLEIKRTMRNATNVNPQLSMETLVSGCIAFFSV